MPRPSLGPRYRRLLVAATISFVGDGAFLAAFPLLAATVTRDPRLVAGVVFMERLPWMLFAVVSGAIVDRGDRRLVMGYVDAFRAVLTAGFSVLVLTGHATIALIYVFAFVLGVTETLFDNASQAILPSLVETGALERANAGLQSSLVVGTQFAGPPLGSFLFAAAASLPFFIDAGSFAASAAIVLLLIRLPRRVPPPERTRAPLRTEIAEGFRWLWRHRVLRALAIMLGIWNLVETGILSVLVLFALEVLHVSAAAYGVLLAAGAVGGLAGAALAPRVSRALGPGRSLVACAAVSIVAYVLEGAIANVYLVGAMLAVIGAAALVWNVITVSLRQAVIPDHLLGRVNSIYRFAGWGTMPIGAAMGGLLARSLGLRAPFFFGAAVLFVTMLVALPVLGGSAVSDARAAVADDARRGGSDA